LRFHRDDPPYGRAECDKERAQQVDGEDRCHQGLGLLRGALCSRSAAARASSFAALSR
jgi:hypothetical protein